MKANMGSADRAIRVVVAVVLLGLYFGKVVTGTLGWVLFGVAVLFLATSTFSFCPGYVPFGFSSRGTQA